MYTRQHLTKSPKKGGRVRVTLMPAALVIGLLICASLTTGAHTPWATVATPDTAPQSGGEQQEAVPSQLSITIRSQGMTPANAIIRTGIVHLFLENPDGIESLKLRVRRESGEVVREINVPNKAAQWATELELSAGQYVISEVSNPSWSCHITAQAPPDNTTVPPGAVSNP